MGISIVLYLTRQGWYSAVIYIYIYLTMNIYVVLMIATILSVTQSALKLYTGGLFKPGHKKDTGKTIEPVDTEKNGRGNIKSFNVFGEENTKGFIGDNNLNFGNQFTHRFSKGTSFQHQHSFTSVNQFPFHLPTNKEDTTTTSTTTTTTSRQQPTTTTTTTQQPEEKTVASKDSSSTFADLSKVLYGKYGKFGLSFVI